MKLLIPRRVPCAVVIDERSPDEREGRRVCQERGTTAWRNDVHMVDGQVWHLLIPLCDKHAPPLGEKPVAPGFEKAERPGFFARLLTYVGMLHVGIDIGAAECLRVDVYPFAWCCWGWFAGKPDNLYLGPVWISTSKRLLPWASAASAPRGDAH